MSKKKKKEPEAEEIEEVVEAKEPKKKAPKKKKEKEPELEVVEEEPELEKIEEIEVLEDDEERPPAEEVAPSEVIPEEEIVDERIYTVPLRKAYWTGSRLRRSNRAVRILRQFVERHMKPEDIVIQPEVNDRIWSRGIQKPPRRIRIRATKNTDDLVRVYLAEG